MLVEARSAWASQELRVKYLCLYLDCLHYHWSGSQLARGSSSFSSLSLISVTPSLQTDVRQLFINGYPVVVEAGRLQDDPCRPHHHGHREDPEEQSVKDHGHVLPVLLCLK